jgi:hypothetical protein
MTATPYTNNPMDLIKLINLMKEDGEELPEDFNEFSNTYLDDKSNFTDKGAELYLNNISGYISYLNRERDARQFAYPVFYNVIVSLSENNNALETNKELLKTEIYNINKKLKDKTLSKDDKISLNEKLKILKQDYKSSKKNIRKDNISQEDVFDLCLKNK